MDVNTHEAEFLGHSYRDAILVPKDLKESLYWYKKSAELGNNSALLQVALFYAHGYAVKKILLKLKSSHLLKTKSINEGNPT